MAKTEVEASYKHVSLKIFKEFPKVLENIALELAKKKGQFRISIESKVDNPLVTLESFNRQFQLSKDQRDAVEWGWSKEGTGQIFHFDKRF